MQYHSVAILVLRPLIMEHGLMNAYDFNNTAELVSTAQSCLITLLHLFYHCHGFEAYYIFLLQVFSQIGFDSIERLRELERARHSLYPEGKAIRATLMLCAKGLHDQGQNFYLSECVYKILCKSMSSDDTKCFRDWTNITGDEDREPLMIEHVHSEYPVNISAITQDPSDHRLYRLLENWPPSSVRRGEGESKRHREGPPPRS